MSIPTLRSLDLKTKKRRVPREARLRLPWSVWADAHDLEFEFEFKDFKRLAWEAHPNHPFRMLSSASFNS
jgi:hypothetical protein